MNAPAIAIETSTTRGSVALFSGGRCAAERVLAAGARSTQPLFVALREMLAGASLAPAEVRAWIVGRGPGHYSGLRVAMVLARSIALPSGAGVYAVSSGGALAAEILDGAPDAPVAVVGDARRGRLWFGLFERAPSGARAAVDWRLIRPEELASLVPPGGVAVTSERARLEALGAIDAAGSRAVRWIAGDRHPTARRAGEWALRRMELGEASDPLAPLYMHPAVDPAAGRADGGGRP